MKNEFLRLFIGLALLGLLLGSPSTGFCKDKQVVPKDAKRATAVANAKVWQQLPFSNTDDFGDARKGFIATWPDFVIPKDDGSSIAWTLRGYEFLSSPDTPPSPAQVPSTVNPSLWRQAVLNLNNGLFKVAGGEGQGIYQVRGFDLASMMIIEGRSGIILIDPMSSIETARAALQLYRQYRDPEGKRSVKAVIYTHTHADHFSGARGVVSQEDLGKGVKILAPEGFLENAISENVFAGPAMSRRAIYQYGMILPRGARGQVDSGLGKGNSIGTTSIIAPNKTIKEPGEELEVDGVRMEFVLAPETEAPSEMLIWFPQFKALCAAEDMNHLNHNLYTLRGAEVRNAKNWWKVINGVLDRYGDRAEVMFFAHTWPVWGQEKIVNFMKKQRDLYKYVHDQSLHLMNQGSTMIEVAEALTLPPSLAQEWFNRDFYGTVNHNAKAVYQKYLGWYDGNPANLHPLPPEESAKLYLEYMGGSEEVIARAREAFKHGDYRWVAQIMNHVVFAEPGNKAAKRLQADTLEQLGYQAESGIWRNHYLSATYELRNGVPPAPGKSPISADAFRAMTLDLYFDYLGILLNGPKANGENIVLNWRVSNSSSPDEEWVLTLENSVLTYNGPGRQSGSADATIRLSRKTLDDINTSANWTEAWHSAIASGDVVVDGSADRLFDLLDLLEEFKPMFNIVTP
jgi:alkyl sulfatase BDS1-like metallo-beta-lactamase superfamily hydrolase